MAGFSPRMERIIGSATVGISNLVAERRRAGQDIVSFSVGEPDFPTPAHIVQAAKDALDAGHTKYTPGPGIPALREAVARVAVEQIKIPALPANVLVSPAKQAVAMSVLALVGAGDEVLVPDPGWVSYEPMVHWANGRPVPVPGVAEHDFAMRADDVQERITKKTKLIIINSPSNPTGAVTPVAEIKAITELAIDHDFWVISDELYRHLVYEGTHLSPASLPDAFERVITIDGLSKAYAMTGWRLGWAIAPPAAFKEINKLQEHSVTHCTSFAQYGGVAALNGPQDSIKMMRTEFMARRKLMVDGLNALPGVTCPMPHGAFYVFPKFEQAGLDDTAFAQRMISEAGVAPTPGSAFGKSGVGHLRLSYATNQTQIKEGLSRIEKFLNK